MGEMLKVKNSLGLYRRILSYTLIYKTTFILAMIAIAFSGLLEAGLFYLLKPILDEGFVGKNLAFIKLMPWLIVGLFILMSTLSFFGSMGTQWVAQKVIETLRYKMYCQLLTLPQADYDRETTGGYLSKLTYDVNQLLNISTTSLMILIKDSFIIIGLVVVMFVQNWKISAFVILTSPFIYLVLTKLARRLRSLARRTQSQMGALNHIAEESIKGHREIKLFSAYQEMEGRFAKINRDIRHLNMKIVVAAELSSPLSQVLLVICVAVVIWYASIQTVQDEFTVGGFLSLIAAMIALLNPIKRLTRLNEQLQRGFAGAEGVFELIDAKKEPNESQYQFSQIRGDIQFAGVEFSYENTQQKALKGVDLHIKPQETVALVGPSGSGKSTFANLLARFYQPTKGEILVDGINLTEVDLVNYRHYISYVGQNVILFADTIEKNIAFGQPSATKEEIVKAAQYANAYEFIQNLPQGFATLVGENGAKLSGGQRQRIAIARALLKNAPILILDEATSSLDTQSERLIQGALEHLSQDKTTIIIAHRLTTIEYADRILVLSQGQIVEEGDHQSLLKKRGVYYELYQTSQVSMSRKMN